MKTAGGHSSSEASDTSTPIAATGRFRRGAGTMHDVRFCPVAFVISLAIGAMIFNVVANSADGRTATPADILRAIDDQVRFEADLERHSHAGPTVRRD